MSQSLTIDNSSIFMAERVLQRERAYDQSSEIIQYLTMFTSCELISPVNTQARAMALFRDLETNEIVLQTEFEYVGSYYPQQYSWIWAWYENWKYPATAINLTKGLVNYALQKNIEFHEERSILLTPVIKVYYHESLELIVSHAMTLTKKDVYPFQIHLENGDVMINYLFLIDSSAVRALKTKVEKSERWKRVLLELYR